jgi:uncharacterized protein (DUF736 family)
MSQLDCGSLTPVINDSRAKYRGNILLGTRINEAFVLASNPRKSGESDAPDYVIYALGNGAPTARQLGSAWLKNSSRGGDFLSLTFDDPDWTAPLYVTAFKQDLSADWRIVWSRPRSQRQQDEAA